MVTGVLLFAVVGHFVLRPAMANSGDLPPIVLGTLLGVALGACALSLVLRRRVPQRSSDDDEARIERGTAMLDDLYSAFQKERSR